MINEEMDTKLIQNNLSQIEVLNRQILSEFENDKNTECKNYKDFKNYANFIKNFMIV